MQFFHVFTRIFIALFTTLLHGLKIWNVSFPLTMMQARFGRILSAFRGDIANYLCIVSRKLSTSSGDVASKTIAEALDTIKTKLDNQTKTRIFLGTGQYFTHETNERIIALSLGEVNSLEPPQELIDTGILAGELKTFEQQVSTLEKCSGLLTGEIDCVNDEGWEFGFSNSPTFSIFSKFGYCLTMVDLNAGPAFRIFSGPLYEDIYLQDIQNLQVVLSEEPWEERKLEVRLKNDEVVTIAEDVRESSQDLSQLMMTTEWMIKAAGHLCLVARLVGGCKNVVLKLPDPLRAENNPWIEMRNKTWIQRASETNDS